MIDLDKPWQSFLVTEGLCGITNMIWARTGYRVLVTTVDGSCSVWEMEVGIHKHDLGQNWLPFTGHYG